jgi:protein ImuB
MRSQVVLANSHAASLGVRVGMPLGAAQILGDLMVFPRDERAERQALERLCAWSYQFTPIVSAVPPDGLLLEVKGSLKLFGGVDELLNRVRRGLRDLGYRSTIAVAPTPAAATALARAERQRTVFSKEELPNVLGSLPLEVLRLAPKQLAVLNSIGARSIGDCLRLPRGGLGRRTAPKVVDIFARLIGRLPDPRPRFELPRLFQNRLELPWETSNAQSLGAAGERLLHELVGYLRSCASMTRRLRWSLSYAGGRAVHFQLELTQASREQAHFALLLREQLSRIQLDGPIRGIALYVDDITPDRTAGEDDLFKHRREGTGEDWPGFLDRLRARLGEQAVRGLQRIADHRPECAWRWSHARAHDNTAARAPDRVVSRAPERPAWLMRRPIRLQTQQGHLHINGPLHLLEGRERIETGWWDGKPIGRDYFIAANPSGARLWIYRELSGERNWYLHGIFE